MASFIYKDLAIILNVSNELSWVEYKVLLILNSTNKVYTYTQLILNSKYL